MAGLTAKTIPEMLLKRVRSTPAKDALMYPSGSGWNTLTWKQVGDDVMAIAAGLRVLGLNDEGRCASRAGARYEWVRVGWGIQCAFGATTTIYPSTTPADTSYILNDSDSRFVFAENEEQVAKLQSIRAEIPRIQNVIVIDGAASA